MKDVLRLFVIIPNLPITIVVAMYVVVNILLNTGFVEMQLLDDNDDLINDDIKTHINNIYPIQFRYVVAIIFYVWVGMSVW